jgi:WD40 repeat protein
VRKLVFIVFLFVSGLSWVGAANAQYFRYGKNKVHYEDREWFYIQSEHFLVYYYENGEYIADFATRAAEEAFSSLQKLFDFSPEERIPIIVYPNHGDFSVTNAVNLPMYTDGIGGVTEMFKNRIAIPFGGNYADFRRVVHHELVHAVINAVYYGGSIQSLIQTGTKMRIPLWFGEGLAEYQALGWDTNSDLYIREAILEDELAPIEELYGYYTYRGGQSVWDYIAEQYGDEKIAEILHRLRDSRSVEQAIDRSIGLDLGELSERWQRALREVYFPEVTARESLEEIAEPVITRKHGFYNTSPALSPLGDKLAYVTTTSGLFDIYIANTADGEVEKRLVQGQLSRDFEALPVLTPGLAWSPDGRQIAVAVRSGNREAIALINVLTGVTRRIETPTLEQILSLAWSPDGAKIAVSATNGIQSDIYSIILESEEILNLTDDVFSDFEPAWSPDGNVIVFHSDRGSNTEIRSFKEDSFKIFEHLDEQTNLYLLTEESRFVRRLTMDEMWSNRSARFGPDPDRVVFISDRNGIPNLYEKHLINGQIRALTDLDVGVLQIAMSSKSEIAAVVSLHKGTPTIYTIQKPFERTQPRDPLMPNVWAQRVDQTDFRVAPALAIAGRARLEGNPFLRDAYDGIPYSRGRQRLLPDQPVHVALKDLIIPAIEADSISLALSRNRNSITLPVDSFARGVQVDFESLTKREEPADLNELLPASALQLLPIVDNAGNYVPQKYKLRFSPDIVYGAAGYDALYGVQGITQMEFSDMLGDHKIIVATNLLLDLRNSDYTLSYHYLPRRIDWSLTTFHISRLLADFTVDDPTYYRYRQYGAHVEASFPLDKFHRIDARVGIIGVNQADVTDVTRPSSSRTLLVPSITYTKDTTTPGFTYPVSGTRLAISLSGAPTSFTDSSIRFGTVLFDSRLYSSFGKARYTWAMRLSAGSSFGPYQQVFYTSGVQNWLNRNFDDVNGFPLDDVADFVFATPIMPLRGFDINAANGSHFSVINAEFRFPLVAALLPGPIPVIPLYNIQGQVFADIGNVWGGRSSDGKFKTNSPGETEMRPRRYDDLLIGTGFGIRTLFLGYPVRLDFAWPFDGKEFGDRNTYISVGLDF